MPDQVKAVKTVEEYLKDTNVNAIGVVKRLDQLGLSSLYSPYIKSIVESSVGDKGLYGMFNDDKKDDKTLSGFVGEKKDPSSKVTPPAKTMEREQTIVERNRENGRDTKILMITEDQWDKMSDIEKYQTLGTIFVDQNMGNVKEFSKEVSAYSYGDAVNFISAHVPEDKGKILFESNDKGFAIAGLDGDTLAQVDAIVEGENVVTNEGKVLEDNYIEGAAMSEEDYEKQPDVVDLTEKSVADDFDVDLTEADWSGGTIDDDGNIVSSASVEDEFIMAMK